MIKGTLGPTSWVHVKSLMAQLDHVADIAGVCWADMTPLQKAVCRVSGAIEFHERAADTLIDRAINVEAIQWMGLEPNN